MRDGMPAASTLAAGWGGGRVRQLHPLLPAQVPRAAVMVRLRLLPQRPARQPVQRIVLVRLRLIPAQTEIVRALREGLGLLENVKVQTATADAVAI
jgi:hypothetical protein